MKLSVKKSKESSAIKSYGRGAGFWRKVVSAVLCTVMLGTNVAGALATEASMNEISPLAEENVQITGSPETQCTHHTMHDEDCGYTEENPVCNFVCAICPVQEQIDAVLAQLEQAENEELDEEGMLSFWKQALAAKRAFERLEWKQQAQVDGIDTIVLILETLGIQPLADGDTVVTGMQIATALIKTEGEADQSLSSGTFAVDFSKQFTLHIVVKSALNLPNKKVEITVPDGLTVVEFPIPERGGMVEGVTPESAADLKSSNTYGSYCPQNGTITYNLKAVSEESSFNIILAPDTVLWNRRNGQELAEQLDIKVYTDGEGGQEYETVSATAKITGKYNTIPTDNRAIQTGPRLSRIGVKTGVPTAANMPFALRQIWLNPDKDYIDMPQFFRELEITLALPYYESGGDRVYAALDHITYDPAGQSTRKNMMDPENHKDAGGNYLNSFDFEQKTNDDHTVTLKWTNLYLEYGQEYFTPYFMWEDGSTPADNTSVKWDNSAIFLNNGNTGAAPTVANAAVGGKITWQDNSVWYPLSQFVGLSVTAHSDESMSVSGNKAPDIYNAHSSDSDIIYYLGQFHVVNHGGAASADKTVEFTYVNNGKIGVTAQKIPATTGNTVTVCYQTTKTTGDIWTDYTAETLKSEGGFVIFTAKMAGLAEDEYFTKIKAKVGSYERDYVSYVASRSSDPTSGYATTFGKLLTGDPGTYTGFASMKMYDTNSGGNEITGQYNVKTIETKGEIPLAMEQAYKENTLERLPILSDPKTGESKTAITAGDTVTFNGLLSSSAYPYSSNNITTDQVIYIRLPEKITVKNLKLYREAGRKADKVFLIDAVTETVLNPTRTPIPETKYEFKEVSTAAAAADDISATSYKLYKITFTDTANPEKVGWFTDELGQYQIGISFDMEIAKDADAMTLDMRDCVRFKSASLISTSNNGTLSQYQVFDTNDMDGDGDTTERFSTFNVNAEGTKLSVVAARLGLTFTFGARVAEKGSEPNWKETDYSNYEADGEKVYLKDETHVVDMLFTLKNETGRAFSEQDTRAFYYFIPVPKAEDLWDSHIQDQPFAFDMNLTRAPSVEGVSRDNVLVTYATDIESTAQSGTDAHYTNTAKYVTESQLLDGLTTEKEIAAAWAKVKMIRIAAGENVTSIRKEAYLEVNMRLEPTFRNDQEHFDSMADLVGSVINFGPCGVSPYSVGNTPNQGHNPLPRIQVEFQTGVIAGQIFLDKNFNGTYEKDVDALYTAGGVKVEAKHQTTGAADEGENQDLTTTTETFKFSRRRADTYHVVVTNPGSTDANGTNPLKFSLPETNGKFSEDQGKNTATATVILDVNETTNDNTAAQNLMIGFQQPHTVTFTASNASLGKNSTKVWHGEKLGENLPTVTATEGYRFTGWTVGGKTYDVNNSTDLETLKALVINEDTTVTAEVKRLYSVTYDGNDNTEGTVPPTTQHIEGEKVKPDYNGTNTLKKSTAIFVGWSETKITDVLKEDAAQETIDKIISTDEHTMPARNVLLYAVYAVDANGNGNPDYNDDAVHVRYHGNNNDRRDVICPHHHVVGATAQLSTSGVVSGRMLAHDAAASTADSNVISHTFTYGTNIFVGWSTKPILDTVIETKTQYDNLKDSIKTAVTMLEKPGPDVPEVDAKDTSLYADADGNTNVYAVWAADRNGNKRADYDEEHKLIYNGNAQSGGNASNVPAEVTTTADSKPIIPGDTVTLDTTQKPDHTDVEGKKVVFVGWTETQTNSIFSRKDTAPATVKSVTFGTDDKTVYAVWGYDENGNGTADVLETYTLTYDLNGGKETAPAKVTNIAKNTEVTLTTDKSFTRGENELFVGWSTTPHTEALTAEAQEEDVGKFLITGLTYRIGTADVTLYAVWAIDSDGDGRPDYKTTYTVTYDLNGGSPVEGMTYDPDQVDPGATYRIKVAPKRSDYSFAGWKDDESGTTYQAEEELIVNADLTLTAQWTPTTGDGNLTVSKTVLGNAGETNRDFHFIVTLSNTTVNGTFGEMTFTNGTAAFTLKHNEKKTANGLLAGITYEVKETEANQDGYTTRCIGQIGTIAKDMTATAAFVNTKGTDAGAGSGGGETTHYTLHYESNGGTEYGDEWYAKDAVVQIDKVPTREGYSFTGWYADEKLTERITKIQMTGSKTVYAGWEPTGVPDWLNGEKHIAYVAGYVDGTVRPLNDISRAEVAMIFFRLLDEDIREENLTASNAFADVNENMWCNTAISTMAKLGILKGRTPEYFDVNAPITRAEFAAICARFDTSKHKGESRFSDISGHWAEAEITRAAALGWIAGHTDGTFRPENYITRAEAMTMINRMLNRLPEDEDDLLDGMNVWPDNKPGTWYYLMVQEATNSHDFIRKGDVHERWTKIVPTQIG